MKLYRPPSEISTARRHAVFLAGSIDNGLAQNWQEEIIQHLSTMDIDIYNPRRDSWKKEWLARNDDPVFREQVQWELDAMEKADTIIMYLVAGSQSPVSLLELGLHAAGNKLLVCCPDNFWRAGNVYLVCSRYGVPCFDTIEKLINAFKLKYNEHKSVPAY
jgi:Nucleoside 2-deoxyribosyltransferase like